MEVIFVVLFFAIGIAASSYFTSDKTLKPKKFQNITFKVSKTFVKTFNVNEGEEVVMWLNSSVEEVFFYLKGTHSGQGKIGSSKDWYFINMSESDDPNVKCVISKIQDNYITLEVQY
jgi:hypothetical protein